MQIILKSEQGIIRREFLTKGQRILRLVVGEGSAGSSSVESSGSFGKYRKVQLERHIRARLWTILKDEVVSFGLYSIGNVEV